MNVTQIGMIQDLISSREKSHAERGMKLIGNPSSPGAPVVGQMEKGWREEVGLVTGSLRKKLVTFYKDAVDGYDDTTA